MRSNTRTPLVLQDAGFKSGQNVAQSGIWTADSHSDNGSLLQDECRISWAVLRPPSPNISGRVSELSVMRTADVAFRESATGRQTYPSKECTVSISLRDLSVSIDSGVIQANSGSNEFWLVYRRSTGRWLVIHSTVISVPLGCTLDGPANTAAAAVLVADSLQLCPPSFVPVLSAQMVAATVSIIDPALVAHRLVACHKDVRRQLWLLSGPPGSGKTAYSQSRRELRDSESVVLSISATMRLLVYKLFRKLATARRAGRTDPFQKEAFLIEALTLWNSFHEHCEDILWRGPTSALQLSLQRGLSLIVESDGSELEMVDIVIQQARKHGYRITALCFRASNELLQSRAEDRFDRELELCEMLGHSYTPQMDNHSDMPGGARFHDASLGRLVRLTDGFASHYGPLVDDIGHISCDDSWSCTLQNGGGAASLRPSSSDGCHSTLDGKTGMSNNQVIASEDGNAGLTNACLALAHEMEVLSSYLNEAEHVMNAAT